MPVRALAEIESIRDWDLAAVVKSTLPLIRKQMGLSKAGTVAQTFSS